MGQHARFTRSLLAGIGLLLISQGCTRNYYCYPEPPGICSPNAPAVIGSTAPAPARVVQRSSSPVIIDEGTYCSVPQSSKGSAVASSRSSSVIVNSAPPARVVINDPNYQGYTRSRGWRNRKEYVKGGSGESASTRVSGTYDDLDVVR